MDWQVITGISSTVIALCALGFTIWQGMQTRKHNRISYRPHLTTWTHRNTEKGFYAIELINNGIGPAVIENFIVKVDDKRISGDGTEPMEKALKIVFPNLAYQSHQSYVALGYSMAPKERCTVVAVQFLGQQFPSKEFVEHALSRGDLEISYKSLYEEVFQLSTKRERALPLTQ
jgi:hypothetical protein